MYNKDDVLKQADNIANKIKNLDTIKTYQQIEAQIHQNQTIKTKMDMLKKHQKQAVNFQNYGKQNSARTVGTYHSKYRSRNKYIAHS
ncbi:hypothetical protein W893_12620 [Staphylococcus aureus subsp. aureus ST 1413]|nr:hypothetical protein W893_12620 [Staphylococcus aureus subsp. aureus ST 1413]